MMSVRLKAGSAALAGLLSAAVLGTGLLAPVSAHAMGDDTTPTCKPGEVYDKKTRQCIKQSGANLSDDNIADYAYSLAKAERYQEALDILGTARNQDNPIVLNYRGYATRKLGRVDEGIGYYLKSVAADPSYAKVREYLGEAYMLKGRPDLAREQLAAIRSICGTGCEEYRDLEEAIATPARG